MNDAPVDREVLMRLQEDLGGPDVVREMVQSFVADAGPLLAAMREGAALGDARALEQSAHTMRSVSAALGAMRLADLCRQLELGAREGVVVDGREQAEAVAREFDRVRVALETGLDVT